MVKKEFLVVAENLAERNKNRLNPNQSPKENETDKLFYWIMSRLEWKMEGSYPANPYYTITAKVSGWTSNGYAMIKHAGETYIADIRGEIIYDIIRDVANAFNEIGESEEKGYWFYATVIIPEHITETAAITVGMNTKV